MSYIQDSLGENETLRYTAHFHWIYKALAYGVLILSIVIGLFTFNQNYPAAALIAPLVGVIIFVAIMLPMWTTEIGVTSQRVILKRGLFTRQTSELQLRSIEEVGFNQDVLGRIFGYGKLDIHGTGEEEIQLPSVGDPLGLRKALQEAIGDVQNGPAPQIVVAAPQPADAG